LDRVAAWALAVATGLVLLATALPAAQAATLGLGEASGLPGQQAVGLPITLTVSSGEQLSVLSADIYFDPLLAAWDTVTLEPSVSALGKHLETNLVAPGHVRLILYGVDRQTLSSGTIGHYVVGIPVSASVGPTTVELRDGLTADPDGHDAVLSLTAGRLWIEAPPDTTPPVLTVSTPPQGAIIPLGTPVVVAGVATDDRPGDVAITVNGQPALRTADGSFALSLSGLPAGTQVITVEAMDAAGNRSQVQRTITVNSPPPPTVQILSPLPGSTITGTSVSVSFSVQNATISTTATHLTLTLDGGSAQPLFSASPYSLTNLQVGTHTVALQLVDAQGQALTNPEAKVAVTFTLQAPSATTPTLIVLTPLPGSTLTGTSVKVQVSVTGIQVRTGDGYAHLHYKIDSGQVSHIYNTNAFWFINLKPGTHTIGVMLADNVTHTRVAGSQYQSITITVVAP